MKNTMTLCLLLATFLLMPSRQGWGWNPTPLACLHVTDSSVLFSAAGYISGTPGNVPISGEGRRMMWYADKAAFRMGYVSGNQWDKDQIGNGSFVGGVSSVASGVEAFSFGDNNVSSGTISTTVGASKCCRRVWVYRNGLYLPCIRPDFCSPWLPL